MGGGLWGMEVWSKAKEEAFVFPHIEDEGMIGGKDQGGFVGT